MNKRADRERLVCKYNTIHELDCNKAFITYNIEYCNIANYSR